jgi:hypothetical protein
MQKMPSMQFFNSIPDQYVRTLNVLAAAFIMGIVFFVTALYILYTSNTPPASAPDASAFTMLSAVNAVIAFTFIIISTIIPRRYLETTSSVVKDALTAETALVRIRSSFIQRVALLEAFSLFGLCLCALAVLNGSLYFSKVYALNAIPALFMILNIVYIFPTKNRITAWYDMIS